MSDTFTPPPPSSWQGAAGGAFTPPPPSSWQGSGQDVQLAKNEQMISAREKSPDSGGYGSQVWGGIQNAVKGLAQVGSEAGGVATDPLHAIEHLKALKKLIVDPQVDQAIQAADKWKAGDRSEAVGHALAAVVPGAGPAAANIGDKLGSGDLTGAAADATVLGGAMALPHVAGPLAEAGAKAGTFTGSAVRAAAPQVAGGAAMIGGGELLAKVPGLELPARLGMQYPGVRMVVAGAKKGFQAGKTALADRLAAITEKSAAAEKATAEAAAQAAPKRLPAAPDASFVRSVPAEPPTPKGLLGPGRTIITPAPSDGTFVPAVPDASFVRSVPAEYPQVEGGSKSGSAPAAPAPPAEDTALLDGIAQGQAKMPFAKLAPAQQEAVRAIARRIQDPTPLTEQPAQPLPARRAPDPGPGPAVSAEAPQTPVRQPAPAATQGPAAPVQTEVNQPETPPVLENARSPYSSSGELKSPQLRAMEIEGANRANRASVMAKALHENGIPLSDAKNITSEQWNSLSKSTGGQVPSQETIDATLSELGKLGQGPGATALQAAKTKNGATVAASKAKLTPKPKAGRTTAQDFLSEPVDYGGQQVTRGEMIRDLQDKGGTQEQISAYLGGRDAAAKLRPQQQ
jgi:hypothetical protein